MEVTFEDTNGYRPVGTLVTTEPTTAKTLRQELAGRLQNSKKANMATAE